MPGGNGFALQVLLGQLDMPIRPMAMRLLLLG